MNIHIYGEAVDEVEMSPIVGLGFEKGIEKGSKTIGWMEGVGFINIESNGLTGF